MIRIKISAWTFSLIAMALFTACGNDDKKLVTPDSKVDVTKGLELKVDFIDYNAEEEVEGTRVVADQKNDTLGKRFVNLGKDLIAEMTIQKDTLRQEKLATTRTLNDGTYTMVAYKNGLYKGEVQGYVDWMGRFIYQSNDVLELAPDTYDFILYNDKISRNGSELILTEANIQTAMLGRTTYTVTATPKHQQITFQMKHCGFRLRFKWESYMPIENPQGSFYSNSSYSVSASYNLGTGTWAAISPGTKNINMVYTKDNNYSPYTVTSNFLYFLPSMEKYDMFFNCGMWASSTYGKTFNLITQMPSSISSLKPNSSYLIKFKIFYNNGLYLMSNGNTGRITQTTFAGGTQTPVAVVLSQSKKLAIALKNANGGQPVAWYPSGGRANSVMYPWGGEASAYNDMDGYKYTWDPNGSYNHTTIKANEQHNYPAFYYAGHYGEELAASGVTVSGNLIGKRWHLPSDGEWKYVYTALGKGNTSLLTAFHKDCAWNGSLADAFFRQVGTTLANDGSAVYWTSGEFNNIDGGRVYIYRDKMQWTWYVKWETLPCRPFIYY